MADHGTRTVAALWAFDGENRYPPQFVSAVAESIADMWDEEAARLRTLAEQWFADFDDEGSPGRWTFEVVYHEVDVPVMSKPLPDQGGSLAESKLRTDTPLGPVWLVPAGLGEEAAKHVARLELSWPDLDGFVAMHTGRGASAAFVVRAPRVALEARGLPVGSAAELPVAEGTAWPPLSAASDETGRS